MRVAFMKPQIFRFAKIEVFSGKKFFFEKNLNLSKIVVLLQRRYG